MAVKVFTPNLQNKSQDGTPEEVAGQLGIVQFNQAGSSIYFDAGDDAAYNAERFNRTVVAVNRPGSGHARPSPQLQKRLGENYLEAIGELDEEIEAACALAGVSKIISAGRSAGGAAAVTYAAYKGLHQQDSGITISGVYAAEMAACGMAGDNGDDARKSARHDYKRYLRQQTKMINDVAGYPDLHRPDPSDAHGLAAIKRGAAIVPNVLSDYYNNDHVWGSRAGLDAAITVAGTLPNAPFQLDFASYSAAASPEIIETLEDELSAVRQAESAAPIRVYRLPNTVHASFDKRSFIADRLGLLLDMVETTQSY